MPRSIEIELKFEVLDRHQVAGFVKGLKPVGSRHIADVYLDSPAGDLFQRGIFVRIRNGGKFDIKFNPEDIGKSLDDHVEHNYCDEVSIPFPFAGSDLARINDTLVGLDLQPISEPSLENLLERNRLVESITIDKHRTSYSDGSFHIDIDSVKDLGEYLEIEQMADEHANSREIIQKMKDRLSGLRLKHVDVGYNELYWRKHNFDLYLKGKYLLAEDRRKYRPHTLSK